MWQAFQEPGPLILEELSIPHILWLLYGILITSLVKLPNSEQTMETKMAHTEEEGLLYQDQTCRGRDQS